MNTAITILEIASALYIVLQFASYAWSRAGQDTPKTAPARTEPAAIAASIEPEPIAEPEEITVAVLDDMPTADLRTLAVRFNKGLGEGYRTHPNRIVGAARLDKARALSQLRPRWNAISPMLQSA
jgi:hypothetical protein